MLAGNQDDPTVVNGHSSKPPKPSDSTMSKSSTSAKSKKKGPLDNMFTSSKTASKGSKVNGGEGVGESKENQSTTSDKPTKV